MKKLIILLIAALLPIVATAADTVSDNSPLTKKEQRRTLRGYKGFVEAGAILNIETVTLWSDFNANHLDLITSHGYQFNNFFYLGGGTGLSGYLQKGVLVPFFGNIRVNFLNGPITPVCDIKGGYSVGRFHGGFYSIDLGLRVKLKTKNAIYVMLGLMYQNDDDPTEHWIKDGFCIIDDLTNAGLSLRIGYEF